MAKSSKSTASQEARIILELSIPQLEANPEASMLRRIDLSAGNGTRVALSQKAATVTITPSFDVQLVELDVNAKKLAENTSITGGTAYKATGNVSSVRPLSVYIDLTGTPNSVVSVVFEFDGKEEFKGDLFIQSSGRLTILKTLP